MTPQAQLTKDQRTARHRGGEAMQHRHLAFLAACIKDMPCAAIEADAARYSSCLRLELADYFAQQLAATNPRFDRMRFLRACGVMAE